jgi:uncharacterized repeat protein (TIGR01451 family)
MKKRIGLIVLTATVVISLLAVMPVSAEVTELWNVTYDGGSYDCAYGVAADADCNVIVTGRSYDGSSYNYHTIKYDSDGNELWNVTYDGGPYDYAYGVAADADCNVIVTGYSDDGSSCNYHTIKYDRDGNELWNVTYDGGLHDCAYGVAADADCNVIVTGYSHDGSSHNYHTIKYGEPAPLNLTKTDDVSDCVDPGDLITYTICYDNLQNLCTALHNVVINDTLPAGVTFDSASPGWTYDSSTRNVTWDIGTVQAEAPETCVTLTVRVNTSTEGQTLTNCAAIDSDETEPRTACVDTVVCVCMLPASAGRT